MSDEKKILTEFFKLEEDTTTLEERNERGNKELYLKGLFQKADEENGNGRIYPKDVLRREVKKYEKLIRDNRALGECVEEGSKILANEGWKDFREIEEGEYIQTLNTETDNIEYQKASRVIEKEPEEDYLIHFHNNNIDIKVTSEHRFPIGGGDEVTAEELFQGEFAGSWLLSKNGKIKVDEISIRKVDYNGKVYCVTVPNSTFYCMGPKGHCFWSKNCDHPDSSVVSLEDASHMVTDLWWKSGNEVHGKLKVLDTEAGQNVKALLEGGVTLGISSRGLGSVREQGGSLVVEDDFELIAFDFVSDPSTTGAFMLQEGNREGNFINRNTKADRINGILTDILT